MGKEERVAETTTLSVAQARAHLVRRAGAWYHAHGAPADPIALVGGIGYLQIDPVAVVAANHHLIAGTRIPKYHPDHLEAALYDHRTLVETYQGIHAIFPMADWRFYDGRTGPLTRIEQEDPETVARVLATIAAHGPVPARHFDAAEDREKIAYGWGSTPRAQAALHALGRRGFIMVHHRVAGEKYYDIAERVLPADTDMTPVSDDERKLHQAEREMIYQGLTTVRRYFALAIKAGSAVPVAIEGVRGSWFLPAAEAEMARTAEPIGANERRAHILAPLDPLVHDRARLEALWGFIYRWEIYVPAAKRAYGPYTLPVLWGDRFVARLDPSLDRKRGVLTFRTIWFEPDVPDDPALYTSLAAEIARFAAFHNATVALGAVLPEQHAPSLARALDAITATTGAV